MFQFLFLFCSRTRHNSTEDLWNEDQYLPDPPYLPSPPDIRVSVTGIQPGQSSCNMDEPKREMDETWDYNYEEQSQAGFVFTPLHILIIHISLQKAQQSTT